MGVGLAATKGESSSSLRGCPIGLYNHYQKSAGFEIQVYLNTDRTPCGGHDSPAQRVPSSWSEKRVSLACVPRQLRDFRSISPYKSDSRFRPIPVLSTALRNMAESLQDGRLVRRSRF